MATTSISPTMAEKAERLAGMAHTFARGRSKISGEGFYVIPASTPGVAHYSSEYGCTCRGHRARGICTHQVACQILQQREDAAISAKVKAADAEKLARFRALQRRKDAAISATVQAAYRARMRTLLANE